jgi:hypothetical protein
MKKTRTVITAERYGQENWKMRLLLYLRFSNQFVALFALLLLAEINKSSSSLRSGLPTQLTFSVFPFSFLSGN